MTQVREEFPMRGLSPYPELLAFAQPGPDGIMPTDRHGVPKARRVHLRSPDPAEPRRPEGLTDAEWRWAISTTRRWTTVSKKFGNRALAVARALAASGCVSLECGLTDGRIVTPPRRWLPHPALADEESQRRDGRRQGQRDLAEQAERLRTRLSSHWPGAAHSLHTDQHDPRLPWLVAAATDLCDGTTYDSLRAFVQHHAGHTKARDDVHKLLLDSGWEPDAVTELGINRSPYIGLGGPINAEHNGRTLDWSGWPGPHDIRLPSDGSIAVRTHDKATTLLVVENRQAAETACDRWPQTPLIWCHGQPADAAVDVISQAASTVDRVIICADADLGGARITARVHDVIPSGTERIVVDAGTVAHPRGAMFGEHAQNELIRIAERDDAVGAFAASCLQRGYAIEQEAPIRAALRAVYEPDLPTNDHNHQETNRWL
ncbi:DUF2399 domain-containing protein [Saccharopolyspora hattusasensis]|uniref:DUF2399 domain-containing protein n=1 Tax=Saccharopolyspora hattusasensis TaxID=1128679 RepID=UPI003D981789